MTLELKAVYLVVSIYGGAALPQHANLNIPWPQRFETIEKCKAVLTAMDSEGIGRARLSCIPHYEIAK